MKKNEGKMRSRDYTMSSKRGRTGTGGEPKVHKFLKEELIPYIGNTYRTSPRNRTINGYSLGGLFAIYTLFTEPGLFKRYIIGSTHLSWDEY